jgi:hypothetical protein
MMVGPRVSIVHYIHHHVLWASFGMNINDGNFFAWWKFFFNTHVGVLVAWCIGVVVAWYNVSSQQSLDNVSHCTHISWTYSSPL